MTSPFPASDSSFRLFRLAALAEAVSWTGLVIGMVFKYLVVENPVGVKIFGPIHGVCFVLYVISVLLNRPAQQWTPKQTLLGLLASIPPLFTLVFERWATRRAPTDELEPAV
jgi:integral membrane protein